MSTDIQRESARVYAFPVRARKSGSCANEQAASVVELAARRLPKVDFGSGWYHEAAIEEAQKEKKR